MDTSGLNRFNWNKREGGRMAEHPVGVEILSSDECWALLNQQRLGRLAVATSGDVDIFPIN